MATLADVRAIALALPEVAETVGGFHGTPTWKVRDKSFVWERPLRARDVADLEALGQRVPSGEIIGVRVATVDKEEVLATVAGAFHIPHFRGYPAVLVELDRIEVEELREVVTDGWLVQAPKRLAKAFLDGTAGGA